MNSVELARQMASRLHGEVAARGHDPWQPLTFVSAEVAHREIDIETANPGAAILRGGRATYVAADNLIVHEDCGTPFERAFLIAHELGHIEMGDAPGDSDALSIDLARSSEPPPVGEERVVDYGRRQRREVQMDLFAREFLLPRAVVRRLHLTENMSASQIAEKLGAPFDVVAQQMLDALLLPPVATSPAEAKPDRPLNDRQRDAALHRGVAYLLEAGPGTGKTKTLCHRVFSLLDEGVDPRQILVLTFSNKAAGELSDRIAAKQKDAAAAMWIGTFHAFGLDLIRRFHVELDLPDNSRMLDRTEAVELLESEYPRLDLKHYQNLYDPTRDIGDILNAISRAKDEVVDAGEYATLVQAMKEKAVTAEQIEAADKAEEIARAYSAYERIKRAANALDFGDLVSLPVKLLEKEGAIRSTLQQTYLHVLVDEYQDVNRSSVRLLRALREDGQNLWAVGDSKQSIYRFRGASSFNMQRFDRDDFPNGKRARLEINYRSLPAIVDAFSSFAAQMRAGGSGSKLSPDRAPDGSLPTFTAVQGADQRRTVGASIEVMRRAGYAYRDQAVLCTGNEKLADAGEALERLGIPVLFLGSLFERTEVKDLLALLSLFTDRRAMGLLRIACWPDFRMSLADVTTVMTYLRANEHDPLKWLDAVDGIADLTPPGRDALRRLAGALEGLKATSRPWDILARIILDRTSMATSISASSAMSDRARGMAIWQFMNFARVQPAAAGLPITRLLNRVRRFLRLGDDRDLRQLPDAAQGIDAVRLMTIHGAKGLEFPVVHIAGINADSMPRSQPPEACPPPEKMIWGAEGDVAQTLTDAHFEEQECLFYVALSRAQDRLFLYAPTEKKNGHRRDVSPYVARLRPFLDELNAAAEAPMPPKAEDLPVPLRIDGRIVTSAAQLGLFERCHRRYLYTYILQVGGRRTLTAFTQMHEAVRTVANAIVAGELAADEETLVKAVGAACEDQSELHDNGNRRDFEALALAMLRFFVTNRSGHTTETPTVLRLVLEQDDVSAQADEVLIRRDGTRVLRRVQTGHQRAGDGDDVTAAAFLLAARAAFPNAVVEFVYLSDQQVLPVTLSAKKLEGRRKKLAGFLASIRAGDFSPERSSYTCPNCPAFFVCGPLPEGDLEKKF